MKSFITALRWALFGLVVLLFNFPIIATLATSLKTTADINAAPPVWLFAPTLDHYGQVLAGERLDFLALLTNSTVIALGGTVLAILLSLPAAYAMVRLRVGRSMLPVITNIRAVPLIILAIPFFLMYQFLGLLDTRLGMALIATIINLPLAIIIFVGFVQDIPSELDEAARVEGATTLQVVWHIIVPLSRPVVTAVAILSFVYAWNEFLFGLILTTRDAMPVTVGSTFFITSYGVLWGATAAAMMLSILPPLVLGLFSYRWLGKALLAGALKG